VVRCTLIRFQALLECLKKLQSERSDSRCFAATKPRAAWSVPKSVRSGDRAFIPCDGSRPAPASVVRNHVRIERAGGANSCSPTASFARFSCRQRTLSTACRATLHLMLHPLQPRCSLVQPRPGPLNDTPPLPTLKLQRRGFPAATSCSDQERKLLARLICSDTSRKMAQR
jgi:hypothetical protein